ncbi:MAG: hypothetical protein HDQ97_05035 [Lachnospiraceae bacterium]|nr:hypothetical protein [Lachnospiraceae bacterium]
MSEYFVKLRSNYLDGTVDLNIIMPNPFVGHKPERFYNSGKKFPVLWLLHGGEDTYADWITYSSVPRLGIWKNTIIVAPSVPNSDFINQPLVGEGYKFYDFFYHELMPFIYNWFPASSDPARNFLAGNSMGCEAVWRYGLLNPGTFGCIAPLGQAPNDYRHLEEYRDMCRDDFRKMAGEKYILSAYGEKGQRLRMREINNICKYATVGDFLDSMENTMARFDEAAKDGRLPRIYLPGNATEMADFKKHTEDLGVTNITFDLSDKPSYNTDFWENAVEDFMDFAGLENVEKNDGSAPIKTGSNDFEDEENGITLH